MYNVLIVTKLNIFSSIFLNPPHWKAIEDEGSLKV